MQTVLLSLGANLGDPVKTITKAAELIGRNLLSDLRLSALYRTAPVGVTDQPDFVNCAIAGRSESSARQIHDACKEIERLLGRKPRARWHEREIDIDVILVGDVIYDEADIHIPHLRFPERQFVLQPACDLLPDAVCPRSGKTLQQLLAECPDVTSQPRKV